MILLFLLKMVFNSKIQLVKLYLNCCWSNCFVALLMEN